MPTITGTVAFDTLVGGENDDTILGLSGDDSLSGGAGDDSLDGGSGNDTLRGGDGDFDVLMGFSGNDLLDGGAGAADVVDFRGAGQPLTIDLAAGTALGWGEDTLTGIESVFAASQGDTIYGDAGANGLFGYGGNDQLVGRAGNDFLVGGTGNDTLDGGEGVDIVDYSSASAGVTLDLGAGTASGEGIDALIDIEDAILSPHSDTARGTAAGNALRGGAGNDLLQGLGGDDELRGDAGDDTLDGGDGSLDVLQFAAAMSAVTVDLAAGTATGEGNDRVAGFEVVLLSAFGDTASGDGASNILRGNGGNDMLSGRAGNDQLRGDAGNDTIDGGDGQDIAYFSGNFADYRFEFGTGFMVVADERAGSNDGSDTLRGIEILRFADSIATVSDLDTTDDIISMLGAGGSSFSGGVGNDMYLVDDPLDEPIEQPGEGADTVRSSIDWTLGDNLENLVLTGAASIDGTGNSLRNRITGNDAANFLQGGVGNDTLDGGAGADTLAGGSGNDQYIVGQADRISESRGSGVDRVQSEISWVLSANVERLLLTGSAAIAGTGNGGANTLTGNAGANKLGGGGGADRLLGMGGNDVLMGGTGKDQLTGGAGADAFVFNTKLAASTNVDLIKDFTSGQDRIRLDDDIFTAFRFSTQKTLDSAQFHAAAGATAAADADDRIVYDTATGALYYDADGAGGAAAIQFATIGTGTHPLLKAADFAIIA